MADNELDEQDSLPPPIKVREREPALIDKSTTITSHVPLRESERTHDPAPSSDKKDE